MLETFDGFIAALNTETSFRFHKQENSIYTTDIAFEGDRHQKITIKCIKDNTKENVLCFHSTICKIDPKDKSFNKFTQLALKLNLELCYGAIAIQKDKLVLIYSDMFNSLDPERFIKILSYVAAKADELEEKFTKTDIY